MAVGVEEKVIEIVSILKECPENLQEKCFELLLKEFPEKQSSPPEGGEKGQIEEENLQKEDESQQEDFSEKDLHLKARKFIQSNKLTMDHINQIFYKQGEKIHPLYHDLKTTKASESQLRIAMLQALKNAMDNGEFEFNGEEVRAECMLRKCYDAANFTATFKNKKECFEDFTKYNKKSPTIYLSNEGKSELAEVIRQLQ